MADETNDDGGLDLKASDEEIIRRVLDEGGLHQEGLEAERLLLEIVRAVVSRHVDCELRKMGRRDAWKPGNERTNALTAVMDALFEIGAKAGTAGPGVNCPPDAPPEVQEAAEVRRAINQMLAWAQFAAERRANIIGDDGEERPIMRLVTD